jgi:IS30 family transposase
MRGTMNHYKQLTCGQRYQIDGLLKAELAQTDIALIVGVHKSTISREVRRNKGQRGYRPRQAQIKCNERKQSKAVSRFVLSDWILIERLLEQQWSPEQISLWLKQQEHLEISHETIYQYIILDQATGGELYKQLRERKKKRKRYGGGKDRRGKIPNQTSIDERPAVAEQRDRPGADWEGDLIIGSKHKQAIVTMVDRCTRTTLMRKVAFKTAEAVTAVICEMMSSVKALFQTVTFDNGREFAWHEKIAAVLGGEVYFAHPYSSWERGTNENTNGLIRQYFPKDCDFSEITDARIQDVQDRLNNRPRKCLGIKTPNQLLFGIDPPVALGL